MSLRTPFFVLAISLVLASTAMAEGETAAVQLKTVNDRKAVIATVEPVHELSARSRISGTISVVNVKEGDKVKAGDKIAVVGDEKLALPEKFIFRRFGVSYVRLKSGEDVVVQVGQPVDGGIEILSGLRVGDVAVMP